LEPIFTPALDPPDRIPSSRFCWRLPGDNGDDCGFLGFRHGRAVLFNLIHRRRFVLWDPVTDDRRAVDIPPASLGESRITIYHGTVRCVDGDQGHVHGDCHSSPFEVTMLFGDEPNAFVRVYSSETGNWGNVISTAFSFGNLAYHSDILVGNFFYWLLQWDTRNAILQFDFERQSLAQIDVPPLDMHTDWDEHCRIVPAEDGGLVFLVLIDFSLDLWKNKTNCDDAAGWVLERTIQLDKLLSVEPGPRITSPCLVFVEEHNMLFVSTRIGGFLVHLESMQFKKLPQTIEVDHYYPFCSFDTKGNCFPCLFTLYM
jgi:hypothetical protein